MKRRIRSVLSLVLVCVLAVSVLLVDASASDSAPSYEKKFDALASALGIDKSSYTYRDLYVHRTDGAVDWALVYANAGAVNTPSHAVFGEMVAWNYMSFSPFSMGYGVYDPASGVFYDLVDAWEMRFEGLHELTNSGYLQRLLLPEDSSESGHMTMFYRIGDADGDGELSIFDATRIQRCLAELMSFSESDTLDGFSRRGYDLRYISDYNRDGVRSILDVTKIQRRLAELPNILGYTVLASEQISGSGSSRYTLVHTRDALTSALGDAAGAFDLSAFTDDFFSSSAAAAVYLPADGATVESVYIETDSVLHIDITSYGDEGLWLLVGIDSAFLDDIEGFTVDADTLDTVEIPFTNEAAANAYGQNDLASVIHSYAEIGSVLNTMTIADVDWSDRFSRTQFSDEFFSTRCLIPVGVSLSSDADEADPTRMVLNPDGTLEVHYDELTPGTGAISYVTGYRILLLSVEKDAPYERITSIVPVKDNNVIIEPPLSPVPLDFSVDADVRIYDSPERDRAILLTSADEVADTVYGIIGDNGNNPIPELNLSKYDDAFFSTQNLVVAETVLSSGGYSVFVDAVALDIDGTVLIKSYTVTPGAGISVTEDLNTRLLLIAVDRYDGSERNAGLLWQEEVVGLKSAEMPTELPLRYNRVSDLVGNTEGTVLYQGSTCYDPYEQPEIDDVMTDAAYLVTCDADLRYLREACPYFGLDSTLYDELCGAVAEDENYFDTKGIVVAVAMFGGVAENTVSINAMRLEDHVLTLCPSWDVDPGAIEGTTWEAPVNCIAVTAYEIDSADTVYRLAFPSTRAADILMTADDDMKANERYSIDYTLLGTVENYDTDTLQPVTVIDSYEDLSKLSLRSGDLPIPLFFFEENILVAVMTEIEPSDRYDSATPQVRYVTDTNGRYLDIFMDIIYSYPDPESVGRYGIYPTGYDGRYTLHLISLSREQAKFSTEAVHYRTVLHRTVVEDQP